VHHAVLLHNRVNTYLIFMKGSVLVYCWSGLGNWNFLWNHCTASLWRY
jgi:hypothetical protein